MNTLNGDSPVVPGAAADLDELVNSTRSRLLHLIRQVCGDRPTAHLGLCSHHNVGDVALTVAEWRLLREGGTWVVISTTSDRPNPPAVSIPVDAAFVVHGGGNIGDLYPSELALRVAALREHSRSPMLQMPQSIYFKNLSNADDYRRSVAGARGYVLLVRDRDSYEWAERYLDCHVELIPDSALTLGRLSMSVTPSSPLLALLRADAEAVAGRPPVPSSAVVVDWPTEGRFRQDLKLWPRWTRDFALEHSINLPARLDQYLIRKVSYVRLERGLELLSRGRCIITDRLHGHILTTLLGIPQIVLDNSYGKVLGFVDTWGMDRLTPIARASARSTPGSISEMVDRISPG